MSRSFDPVQLGSIELFCKAAELGSFTAAAEALGVTPAAVSRAIGRIEERLGVRLFVRSTRRMRLTDDGQLYHEQCRQALAQIEEAERAITGHQMVPAGVLRISVPTTYGHSRVMPLLPAFRARYPAVSVEVEVSNRNIDFVEQGFDLAIRLGAPPDSRLVARKLEDASMGVFASPDYLSRHGEPRTLDELQQHTSAQFVRPSTGRVMPWVFRRDGADIELQLDSPVRVLEDVLGCVSFARAGGGLVQIYHFVVAEQLARGELVEVLKPYAGRSRPFSILYPHNRHLSARVRAFVDFMLQAVAT
ncbi:LysR family transcriptional regulator [Uliginosibacterium sp. H1]|uniref:LysR family transcriptional regulator n=1 Tax=Uliginosibacterium sp. H1 TaxID=3114757 RepID=UPI002E19159A|nr:LysR family transcriptional regulator [Uliginosibacterium sp. H1]